MEETTITFKTEEFKQVWLLGKKTIVQQGKTATKFVKEFRKDGSNEYLQNLQELVSPKGDILIWMGDFNPETKEFAEIPGVLVQPGSNVPEGYCVKELKACTMGIVTITGKTRDITRGAHNKLVKAAAKQGFEPDYSFGYSMEYYSFDKYELGNDTFEFSYYLPCRKKADFKR